MTNKITQDWDKLKDAVSQLHLFLKDAEPRRLPIGAVVKTDEGLVGVITGIDAPTSPESEWMYSVNIPDTDYAPNSEESWYEAGLLEVLKWEDKTEGGDRQ